MFGGDKADKEGVVKVDDGPVCAGAEDKPLFEPPQRRQDVRFLLRQNLLLHSHGVYVGRLSLQVHQGQQKTQRRRRGQQTIRNLRCCQLSPRAGRPSQGYQTRKYCAF